MTKFSNDNKALKAIMAGAVAFTPVIAVGINAEKASATDGTDYTKINAFIADLNIAYDALGTVDKGLLHSAHGKINTELKKLETDSRVLSLLENPSNTKAKHVVDELIKLLASSSTGYQLKEALEEFDSKVSSQDISDAFGSSITKQQFINYIVFIEANIFSKLKSSQDYNSYFEVFNEVLLDSLDDSVQNDVAIAIALTVKEDLVKDLLKDIVADAGIIKAEKDAFVQLVKNYTPTPTAPGGGGGTPTSPPVEVNKGEVSTGGSTIESNPQSVIDAITKAATVEALVVKLDAGVEVVNIPATILSALKNKNGDAVVVIVAGDASYEIPVAQIDLLAAAASLGVASAELKLVVTVDEVANPLAGKAGFKTLSDAIDFKLSLVAPDDKTVELKNFSKPVQRSISTSTTLNPLTTVGVVFNTDGSVVAVPTFVEDKGANLYRNSNSVYTLIENFKTFNDVNNGKNWSEEYVEKLASRMVVKGTTATTFSPNREITRGEFAAILSRGLGLIPKSSNVKFTDVSSKQAFNLNGEIAAVVEAGIVKGDAKGKFRPYDEISRDEAAIMISRALEFIGSDGVKMDTTKKITNFTDYRYIGNTARPHIQKVYQAGYINGYSNGMFGPSQDTERGQMAKILYNFLQSVKFIN